MAYRIERRFVDHWTLRSLELHSSDVEAPDDRVLAAATYVGLKVLADRLSMEPDFDLLAESGLEDLLGVSLA